eukprot:6909772-Ditylum_brightwellii.AAC.1
MGANIVRSAINEVVYGGIQLLYKDLTTMEGTEIVTLQNKETTNTPDSVKLPSLHGKASLFIDSVNVVVHHLQN